MFKIDSGAENIISVLHSNGYEGYVVGGCVRDMLLGKEPKDWDIATNAKLEQVKQLFNKTIDTGLKHGTVTVVLDENNYEVTTYRLDGKYTDNRRPDEVTFTTCLKDDLSRRDFTINAMAYNNRNGLIDLFGGKDDLSNKTIRTVGNPDERFQEDSLRMMRAIRFACQLDFYPTYHVSNSIIKNKKLINNISQERIRDELCKILLSDEQVRGIETLESSGLLEEILPEIQRLVDFDQKNPHHHKNVFDHTLLVLDSIPNNLILRLSALLHDIGKPASYSEDEKGFGHFYEHHIIGEKIAEGILKRIKFNNDTISKVCILIREHMSRYDFLRKASIKKFINRVGIENLDNLFELQIADIKGSKPPHNFDSVLKLKENVHTILNEKQPLIVKDLAVNGYDLMSIGIESGIKMGKILNYLLERVLENSDLNTKEKLLAIVMKEWVK